MTRSIEALLELGDAIAHPLTACIGTLPDEGAEDMLRIIDAEFEKIDLDAWR